MFLFYAWSLQGKKKKKLIFFLSFYVVRNGTLKIAVIL